MRACTRDIVENENILERDYFFFFFFPTKCDSQREILFARNVICSCRTEIEKF